NQTFTNPLTLNGVGFSETAGGLGAMRMGSGINWAGNITLGTGGARIAPYNTTATISGSISGGNFEANVGTDTLILLGNTTYANTVVCNGVLQSSNNNTQGTLSTGWIALANSGVLQYDPTDAVTFNQTISGGSSTQFRIRRGGSVTYDGN